MQAIIGLRYDIHLATNSGRLATKILIVEDDAPSAQAIGEVLELEGFDVRRAANATDAIAITSAFAPHVVLVDLQLPEVADGRSFVEGYRRSARPAAIEVHRVARAERLHDERDLRHGRVTDDREIEVRRIRGDHAARAAQHLVRIDVSRDIERHAVL